MPARRPISARRAVFVRHAVWTLVAVAAVSCIAAAVLNSAEPAAEQPKQRQPGPVGRYMPFPSLNTHESRAMDTTNGQIWLFDGDRWSRLSPPIPEANREANKHALLPDPTGKLRPKPEEDRNTR